VFSVLAIVFDDGNAAFISTILKSLSTKLERGMLNDIVGLQFGPVNDPLKTLCISLLHIFFQASLLSSIDKEIKLIEGLSLLLILFQFFIRRHFLQGKDRTRLPKDRYRSVFLSNR
jgi:hypothetical protein